jgi:hypothetical protein
VPSDRGLEARTVHVSFRGRWPRLEVSAQSVDSEWVSGFFDDMKLGLICLFVFVAWLVAATGWVRGLAVVWLVHPAVFVLRMVRRRGA